MGLPYPPKKQCDWDQQSQGEKSGNKNQGTAEEDHYGVALLESSDRGSENEKADALKDQEEHEANNHQYVDRSVHRFSRIGPPL